MKKNCIDVPASAESFHCNETQGRLYSCGGGVRMVNDSACQYNKKNIKERLQSVLTLKRYKHSLGVADESEKLAKVYGEDVDKAIVAGLLHDCAKDFPDDMKMRFVKEYHLKLDETILSQPELIHSFLGAKVVKRDYGITDVKIINAIAYHTTGRADMTLLEKIVYIADWIEPNRKDGEFVIMLRKLAYEDLDEAIIQSLLYSIKSLEDKGKQVHHYSIEALEYLKKEILYG